MQKKKRTAVLDDGCCPKLVHGARFDGILEIPVIERPCSFIIPKEIIPFSEREKAASANNTAIGYYEMDPKFAEVLISPEKYIADLKRFGAMISPDCSLYRNAPLSVQITNVYRNRAIGSFYQRKGLYVIPQVRWGNEDTYTTRVLPEKVAFLGLEKHSIISIGTYGCIKSREDKYFFKAGLDSMLETIEPAIVLVYGAMPEYVFGDYLHSTRFVQYNDWMSTRYGGDN